MTKQTKQDKPLTMHDVMLEAIEAQNGLDDAKQGTTSASEHLLAVAKGFYHKDGTTFDMGTSPTGKKEYRGEPTGFLGACYKEETWARDAKGGKMEAIPVCWTQAKSNIKAGVVENLSIKGFNTVSSLRKAIVEKRKKAGTDDSDTTIKVDNTSDLGSDIRPILDAVAAVYDKLDDAAKDAMKGQLVELHTKYVGLLDAVLPVKPTEPTAIDTALKAAIHQH